jgi:hypothetical protein
MHEINACIEALKNTRAKISINIFTDTDFINSNEILSYTNTNFRSNKYKDIDSILEPILVFNTGIDTERRCLANLPSHLPPICPPALARQTYLSIGLDVKTKHFQMKWF